MLENRDAPVGLSLARVRGMDQDLVTWMQIPADDVEGAWEFYGSVFDWSA